MARKGTGKGGGEPGGGEPDSRREGSPEPGAPPGAKRGGRGRRRRGPGRPAGRRYSPEERRHLLETFAKSGMTAEAFCATVDLAPTTLSTWKRRLEAEGPRGLEPRRPGRPKGTGAGSRLPEAVKEEVREAKRRFPFFGLRRIGAFLRRFRGVAVDRRSVGKVLREAELPVAAPVKAVRRHPVKRRFERARPGQLWQSDITSFVLARHHVRVYLVVFLDDHSRYVVSWALGTSCKKEWVADCLMEGIQKYGKPEEVLTDQGPQYFSWRGKSAFQKLLKREGIRHVVARSHHPQTLGKCERLWKSVAQELWERVHPQELEEARERLKHYFAFYNHFRPHQGIRDGIPAERFFGAAEAVRRVTEERLTRGVLQMALGERPRKTAFLVGQVGDRAVSVHGEAGRLVVRTDEGVYEALDLKDLGMERKEAGDGGKDGGAGDDGGDGAGGTGGGDDDGGDDGAGAGEEEEAAGVLPDAGAGGGGAGAVGPGERGGAEEGARGGDGDPRVVAGGVPEGGDPREASGDAVAAVADEPDGAERDGGGAPEAAPEEGEGSARDAGGGEPGGAEAEGPAPGAGPAVGAGAGGAAADASHVEDGDGAGEGGWAGSGSSPRSGPRS